MDPISQGAFGAIFAQTVSSRKKYLAVSILGCIAGLSSVPVRVLGEIWTEHVRCES